MATTSSAASASTRLRRTFHYPSESDSEPDDLDEEHQEQLISSLQDQDAAKTDFYRKAFLSIPLTAALFFLYTLVFNARSAQQVLLTILSLSSVLCTAYILLFMPVQRPERKGKIPLYKIDAASGPVDKYLVYLNAALAGILLLASGASWKHRALEEAWREALPSIVMALTMIARQLLAPVDIEELRMRMYDYKGA
ncbi:hypothetical protein D0864_13659 [Hortaea werneckii]|uniref:Uncharacterized protein n=1 Tax=Hortaea werneckii TaxID=91943 RepID=A0A3M7GGX9_HORWE|nr:hypothetical protein KC323_g2070 [Hortaea werneckii]KAI6872625.1 hypothetical protein KC338_g2008 [Hortaea werneckii]KAI7193208.1 hypothetical protein KC352_g21228 [Hortaea werneckii]KAI7233476.1 hypothetical protein KC330_g5341 [Hortaea werneckii]KAI7356783.1 hypothetical protein KC320_g2014 [Hortaea werneckii]